MSTTRGRLKQTLGHTLATSLFGGGLLAAALAGGACTTDTNQGFGIVQNQIPEVEKGCVVPAQRSDLRSTEGTLDVAIDPQRGYELYPLIKNYLPIAATTPMDIEYNKIDVRSVEVELIPDPGVTFTDTANCPLSFTSPSAVAALMAPGDEAAAIIDVLLPCHAAQLRAQFDAGTLPKSYAQKVFVRASVRARGKHGGSTIMTAPFVFPIRVCYGCLQQGYTEPDFRTFSVDTIPACSSIAENPYPGNPCNPAQDFGPVLCCSVDNAGTNVLCPAIPGRVQ